MLISEFARQTGLTRDTVRFYAKDIEAAEAIRIAQSLEWMTRGKQGRQPDFGSYVS